MRTTTHAVTYALRRTHFHVFPVELQITSSLHHAFKHALTLPGLMHNVGLDDPGRQEYDILLRSELS